MVVGLGTGSTAQFLVAALGRRVQQGLRFTGVPTSEKTSSQARSLNIPLAELADHSHLDLTIDGADEVAKGTLDLVKGLGGALLREKIVASASRRLVIIVDQTKIVDRLGSSAQRRARGGRPLWLAADLVPAQGSGSRSYAPSVAHGYPLPHRWRSLHTGLRLRSDRGSPQFRRQSQWDRRGCGARAFPVDDLAGGGCHHHWH